jgi:hypothetical protein
VGGRPRRSCPSALQAPTVNSAVAIQSLQRYHVWDGFSTSGRHSSLNLCY